MPWAGIHRSQRQLGTTARRMYWRLYNRLQSAIPVRRVVEVGRQSDPRAAGEERHPGWGVKPEQIAAAYRQAELGDPIVQYDLFDDIAERDLTLGGLADSRRDALGGKHVVIQAGGPDKADRQAAAQFRQAWGRLAWRSLIRHQQYCHNFFGFGSSELDWQYNAETGLIEPVKLWNVRNRNFRLATVHNPMDGGPPDAPLIRTSPFDSLGERLIPGKWVITRRTDNTCLARAGIMRGSAWWSAFKMNVTGDWLVFIKRFGLPYILARVADWTSAEQRAMAEMVLDRIGNDGASIVPKNNRLELEFKDGAAPTRSALSDLHSRFAVAADTQNAKRWNGAALASESGDGASSYALAREHGGIRFDLILADWQRIKESIETQIILPWMVMNQIKARPPTVGMHLVKVADPKEFAEVAKIIKNDLGVELSEDQIREHVGVRGPDDTHGDSDDNDEETRHAA